MVRPPVEQDVRGWVLYDADCGICTKLANRWQASLRRHGFVLEPLQSGWIAGELKLSQSAVESEFRVITVTGKHFAGANAYRYLMRQYRWGVPLYIISEIPPFCWTFDRVYRFIASKRYLVSKSCGVHD